MKTKQRIIVTTVLAALLITFVVPFGALAADAPRFVDEMGLLTAAESLELNTKLDAISERHRFDVVIAVVAELDWREARLFAADYYEQHGYGYGENFDGAILLLAIRDRDFGFAATGFGLQAFTTAGQKYLDKHFLPQLGRDDYYGGFMSYADAMDDFLTRAEAGEPYDSGNIPLLPAELNRYRLYAVVGSLALALIIALTITGIWRSQLKSVHREDLAHAYIRQGSMVITNSRDDFLYRKLNRVRRPKERSGGGGFSSSSGRGYTGHSGKF